MRIVIVGADDLGVATARRLIDRGHDAIMIESDKERIDALSDELDCGFLKGDGSKPAILREARPEKTDVLISVGPDDQYNILASLVGRSLGFGRIITKITDPEFQHICAELGLEETIVPNATIARTLADMAEGRQVFDASALVRGDLHFFSFVADEATAGAIAELSLPRQCKVIVLYRDGDYVLPDDDSLIEAGDQVVVLAGSHALDTLRERYGGQTAA